ncbi:MAG: iron-containing alcohol dehydrogenase [Proteobacteria bacterium]|nr:iron-containing alcohol dehydrogenase [Pseudomonadota bacterium]
MPTLANWNYPTSIWFGTGRLKELPQGCAQTKMQRPLLVTDPGLVMLPPVLCALEVLRSAGIETAVFSDIKPNPVGENIESGVVAFKEGRHDGVIAIGGGSAMDAGKAIAFQSGQTVGFWSFEDAADNWLQADPAGIAPIIAIPTTAGTGSEVGRVAVIVKEDEQRKVLIFHPKMMPELVLLDPELTRGLPPQITAATGMDALAHCLEAYCAPGFHPMADGIAVEGLRLIKKWLPVAYRDGSNLEARGHMQVAATMGATAFQKGLGAIHALSHPVGALYDSHHGLTNAVFMPYVLAFNRPAIAGKLPRLAAWLDLPAATEDDAYDAILQWILDLREELGIPHTLIDMGLDDRQMSLICEMAATDPTAATNPIPLNVENLKSIFLAALKG